MRIVPVLTCVFLTAYSFSAGVSDYDVIWDSPSIDSSGSMPIGNGEVCANVWVEKATGDLLILFGRTDSLSEISRVLKIGRVRVHFEGSPLLGTGFQHALRLKNGVMEFRAQGAKLRLFIDSDQPVIHVVGEFSNRIRATATTEIWRDKDRQLPDSEKGSAWSVHDAPFPLIEKADRLLNLENGVAWIHENDTSVVPKLWENQSLTGLKGTFDPLIGRTFGGMIHGVGWKQKNANTLQLSQSKQLDLSIVAHTNIHATKWLAEANQILTKSPAKLAETRTKKWWNQFWDRSYVFAKESPPKMEIPDNNFLLRKGVDAAGGNQFQGEINNWQCWDFPRTGEEMMMGGLSAVLEGRQWHPKDGLALSAHIRPTKNQPGRIFDKVTPGAPDGFLFDTHPGRSLRLVVGSMELTAKDCLKLNEWQSVGASYDAKTGEAFLYLDGKVVAHHVVASTGSMVTQGYVLQRFMQACQARGTYPVKFNGGYFTVEPTPMGRISTPDFRNWGDSHWLQNVRHIYHPMLAQGDTEMTEAFFRMYENSRVLAESRTKKYHGATGSYYPETMTVYGTYSGGDYGWDRKGLQPKEVQCPWWDDAWNQSLEVLGLMLDRWDFTRDSQFLKKRIVPFAVSALQYFDTRFKKDSSGKIVLDPTQAVETYWDGVVNDMPSVAGLISVTQRLCALPSGTISTVDRDFFERMKKATPELPFEKGKLGNQLAPAQKYKTEKSNVENPEQYAVWPFRVAGLGRMYLEEAKRAYETRNFQQDHGWGYDGNVAALLGLADEAGRILNIHVRNSHPAYRWPATWGPNYDWLPDQNHGGNLLNMTNLMLLQSDSLESGGAIRLLPAWPRTWDVEFKLHAPGKTTVECTYVAGKIQRLIVTPASRRKDIVFP